MPDQPDLAERLAARLWSDASAEPANEDWDDYLRAVRQALRDVGVTDDG